MSFLAKVVTFVSHRALRTEGHVFAVTPERVEIAEGLRAALAMLPLLIAALVLERPEMALGAVAAFWNCLCDPQGAKAVRLTTLARFSIMGSVVMTLAALGAHQGYFASIVTMFIFVFLCGLTRSYKPSLGPTPAQAGLILSLAVVIGIALPRPLAGALELGEYFLFGSAWAILFCIYLWPISLQQADRLTLVTVFGRLENMAHFLEVLDARTGTEMDDWVEFDTVHRRGVRLSIERGRALAALDVANHARFNSNMDAAGRVFSALIAIGHIRRQARAPFDAESRALLEGLRKLLQSIGARAIQHAATSDAALVQANQLVQMSADRSDVTARSVAFAGKALRGLVDPEPVSLAGQEQQVIAAAPTGNRIDAQVWRHALRVAVVTVLAFVIGTRLNVALAYWGALAAIIVTQPVSANTWLRILERACGSLIGGSIAALILAAHASPLTMVLFILPLAAAAIASRLVNYGLFVIFLCPMFMLVSDFIHPAGGLIAARFFNEVIGAVLGVIASFLFWPERGSDALIGAISGAVTANMKFASAVLRLDADAMVTLDRLQREAGMASTRLETARERMLMEGRWRSARLKALRDVIVALRLVCGSAAVIEVMREGESSAHDLQRADRYDALSDSLLQALSAREVGKPMPLADGPADDLEQAVRHLVSMFDVYLSGASLRRKNIPV